jgi:hypothetical protein
MYLKHGRSSLPEYKCWQQIKQRCLNPNHRAWPNYGGRGIIMAPEWADDFEAFFDHVGMRPTPRHSLDRIDNAGGYVPGNVRWASWDEQANNRRRHSTAEGLRPPKDRGKKTNFKHGMIHTPEYRVWSLMKDRCLNPRSSNYPYWGGRGIKIYEPWVHDFLVFYEYLGPKPSRQHSLDRIDNNGHYEPGNVRWATRLQQTQNRRPCKTGPDHGNYKHGDTSSPEYRIWTGIKTRCFNPKSDRFDVYGGAGITMCQRWRDSFTEFLSDVGVRPLHHVLVRLDRGGHYSCGHCPECQQCGWPTNCRWATVTESNRTRRHTARTGKLTPIQAEGIRAATGTEQEIATMFNVNRSLIGKIRRGEIWSLPQWADRGGDECL